MMISPTQADASQIKGDNAPKQQPSFTDGADFNMFLRMLTTQMQNQNPLNPTEASDFAVQLATFSSVEQQIQTNQLLGRLTDQILSTDLASWLDREVATDGPVLFTGEAMQFHAPPDTAATRRDLIISTMAGEELARIPVSATSGTINIDPATALPGALPGLSYKVDVADYQGTDLISRSGALQYQLVTEVRSNGTDNHLLVLANGREVRPTDVRALRPAGGAITPN